MGRAVRGISLSILAFTRGILDFRQPTRYDSRKHFRQSIVFEQLEVDNLLKVKEMRHLQHASAVASDHGDGERYKHHFEAGSAELKAFHELLFPWAAKPAEDEYSRYRKIWEDWFDTKIGSDEWKELEARGAALEKLYLGNTDRTVLTK